jgi:dTDP-4-amino-4,6-dideoxygalactose transaminase
MKFNDKTFLKEKNKILMFYPYISTKSLRNLNRTIKSRWVGQGPKVELFEKRFSKKYLNSKNALATGSGTDALHLSYVLSNVKKDDEVIVPIFTCTATNIPLLYMGAKIVFADINPETMNICTESVKKLITKKTKAIVCVHYGGLPCDMEELKKISKKHNLILIEDVAQAIGAKFKNKNVGTFGNFSTYSFQAIKHITTGDGGMLVTKNRNDYNKAKRIRWFGIDRDKKYKGTWSNDIYEVGYKYQMTDISATLGLDSLSEVDGIINYRRKLYYRYLKNFSKFDQIKIIDDHDANKFHAAWLITINIENKDYLQKKLNSKNIEANQVHFRNDKYSIFKKFAKNKKFKNMDYLENRYLVLPLHHKLKLSDIDYISDIVKKNT